jgi:hypothetical protein
MPMLMPRRDGAAGRVSRSRQIIPHKRGIKLLILAHGVVPPEMSLGTELWLQLNPKLVVVFWALAAKRNEGESELDSE